MLNSNTTILISVLVTFFLLFFGEVVREMNGAADVERNEKDAQIVEIKAADQESRDMTLAELGHPQQEFGGHGDFARLLFWPVLIVVLAWLGRSLYFLGTWVLLLRAHGKIEKAAHTMLVIALIIMCSIGAH